MQTLEKEAEELLGVLLVSTLCVTLARSKVGKDNVSLPTLMLAKRGSFLIAS